MLDPIKKAKWLEALRSDKFTQTIGQLKHAQGGFCCLGVYCDVNIEGTWQPQSDGSSYIDFVPKDDTSPRDCVCLPGVEKEGISTENLSRLIAMNDVDGQNFLQIADWIEANL
jgi:hypothetical protein